VDFYTILKIKQSMKKLFLVSAILLAFAVQSKAQYNYPRLPYESHTLGNGSNLLYKTLSVRDTNGTGDTVWLDLNARYTDIYINNGVLGDSLNGTITLALIDTTIAARRYRTSNLYKGDEINIYYKTPTTSKRDTIQFAGLFNTGTAVGYIISPSDSVQHSHFLHFKFDGAKFYQPHTGK